jgi:hypothetical protein
MFETNIILLYLFFAGKRFFELKKMTFIEHAFLNNKSQS